jgi:hypothetical protein
MGTSSAIATHRLSMALESAAAGQKFWRQNNYSQTEAAMHQTHTMTSDFTMQCVRFSFFPFVCLVEERLCGRLVGPTTAAALPCASTVLSSSSSSSQQRTTAANSNERRGGAPPRRLVGYSLPFVGASSSRLLPFSCCFRGRSSCSARVRLWHPPEGSGLPPPTPVRATQRIGGQEVFAAPLAFASPPLRCTPGVRRLAIRPRRRLEQQRHARSRPQSSNTTNNKRGTCNKCSNSRAWRAMQHRLRRAHTSARSPIPPRCLKA